LLTPHDFSIVSMKGMHFTAQAGHLGDSETRVTRRVNFPRKSDLISRNHIALKMMMERITIMGQECPKEYRDELMSTSKPPTKQEYCMKTDCEVTEDRTTGVEMTVCYACKKTYCHDHYAEHECCDTSYLVNSTGHTFVADWQVHGGETFDLLDPTIAQGSYYRPPVRNNPSSSSETQGLGASAKKMPTSRRSGSRPPIVLKPAIPPVPKFSEPIGPPPARACPPAEDAETANKRSLTAVVDIPGNTEGEKRQRNMERETAVRSKSMHSEDATPHPKLWKEVGDPSSEESEDDPTKDKSGVPYEVDVITDEEATAAADVNATSRLDTAVLETAIPDVTAEGGTSPPGKEEAKPKDEDRTIDDMFRVLDKANARMDSAELEKADLKRKHELVLNQHELVLGSAHAEIQMLKNMVVELQANVADLKKGNERPVVQAEVAESSSSSTQINRSLDSWVLAAPLQEPPNLVISPETIAEVTGAVQGVLLTAQQAAVISPGKCFHGEMVSNVTEWSEGGEVSPGTPQEIATSPVLPVIGTAVEVTEAVPLSAAIPVSATWQMYPRGEEPSAPSSPAADYGQDDDVHSPVGDAAAPSTPTRTTSQSPRSLSARAGKSFMGLFTRSPSQKRR
jgi:hypothetical protein